EVTLSGGVRPKLWEVEFDFGWTYFHYPGEVPISPTGSTEYWEVAARADTKIRDVLRVAGGFAYSPSISNTGAWSKYVAFGMGLDLPRAALPPNVTASLTAGPAISGSAIKPLRWAGFHCRPI
ncbi:MAG TPA: hypothetical protein VK754_15635, partial [Propionibacteriaceae bacterium]|nr:hypothetical protein [Propionibacteriaceae bacterium]